MNKALALTGPLLLMLLFSCARTGGNGEGMLASRQKLTNGTDEVNELKVAEEGDYRAASALDWEGAVTTDGVLRDIHFDYNASEPGRDELDTLGRIAAYLAANREIRLVVEGHCDDRGSQEYNLALGERRAESIFAFLIGHGVNKTRLETVSYGEERPLDLSGTEEGHSKNRRIHFEVKR